MWGDESENEDEEGKEQKEEKDASGKNGDSQSELVAKDDNQGKYFLHFLFNVLMFKWVHVSEQ